MFSRPQRISAVLFNEALQKGASFKSPHFSIAVLGVSAKVGPKIAVVVSRKVASKATKRNRLRRQARAWVKKHTQNQTLQKAPIVLIVFINTSWQGSFPVAFQQELSKLLSSVAQRV